MAYNFVLMTFGFENLQRTPQAYQWLCKAYDNNATNEIIPTGYSRGDFAARAVAGIVNRHGLLKAADGNYDSQGFLAKCRKLMATYFTKNYEITAKDPDPLGLSEDVVEPSTLGDFRTKYEISAICRWETVR